MEAAALAGAFARAGAAPAFLVFAVAFAVYYPASGAFVCVSQASLMDAAPAGREQSMARWALTGSAGVLLGPLLLAAILAAGLGWRGGVASLAVLGLALVALVPLRILTTGWCAMLQARLHESCRGAAARSSRSPPWWAWPARCRRSCSASWPTPPGSRRRCGCRSSRRSWSWRASDASGRLAG